MNKRSDIPEPEREREPDEYRKKQEPPDEVRRQGEADEDEIVRIEKESEE